MIRTIATAAVAIAVSLAASSFAVAQQAPRSADAAWVQWTADGTPHARAIVHHGGCPRLEFGSRSIAMTERSTPGDGFDDRVCDAQLPADAVQPHVGAFALPSVPRAPKRIAIIGDTGCLITNGATQGCSNAAAWPFPQIARAVAAAHPDLVIHTGDYYYRQQPCPSVANCADSPYGDTSASWNADFFGPMTPLFAVAPIIAVRGNHESCDRAAEGWGRYLSGRADTECVAHEPPAYARFDGLLLANVDDAAERTETMMEPATWLADLALVQTRSRVAARETWLLAHRPAIAYLVTHENTDVTHDVDAFVSGHIHIFGAYSFLGLAPQFIAGMGGNTLADDDDVKLVRSLDGTTDRRFGYAIFNRDGTGWSIEVYDVDGAVHRRCRLDKRKLSCGPSLTDPK